MKATLPESPLLQNKHFERPAVFQPENLLRETRRQKSLPTGCVPEVCTLDPDGEIEHQRKPSTKKLNMNHPSRTVFGRSNHRLSVAIMAAMLACCGTATLTPADEPRHEGPGGAATDVPSQPEPWTKTQLMEPAELAKILNDPASKKPIILDIGVAGWLKGGLIKNSIFIGPANDAKNLEKLRAAVSAYPKNAEVVIYCGCCPFKDCPNIRPAFKLLANMKFTHLKLLDLPHNLKTDWSGRGFPTEK